jgi:hypothetical protein
MPAWCHGSLKPTAIVAGTAERRSESLAFDKLALYW